MQGEKKNTFLEPAYGLGIFSRILSRSATQTIDAYEIVNNKHLGTKLNGFTNLYTLFLLKSIAQLQLGGRLAIIPLKTHLFLPKPQPLPVYWTGGLGSMPASSIVTS